MVGAVLAAGLGIGTLAGCGDVAPDKAAEPPVPDYQREQIISDGGRNDVTSHIGTTVTTRTYLTDIAGERLFIVSGLDGNDTEMMLVIGPKNGPPLSERSPVLVTGEVRRALDVAAAGSEFGVDLGDVRFEPYRGKPYIVAQEIKPDG